MKKKHMNFLQASDAYDISLFGDVDKDKVPNVFDCKPFDDKRDGLLGRAVNVFSGGRYGQSKEEYEAEKSSVTHFERDSKGRVVEVTRNGRVVDPEELKMKSVVQLEREYHKKHPVPKERPSVLRDVVAGLSGRTPAEIEASHKKHIEQLKLANLPLKRRLEIKKAKEERERLLKQLYPQPTGYIMTPWGPQPVFQQQPKKKTKRKRKLKGKKK